MGWSSQVFCMYLGSRNNAMMSCIHVTSFKIFFAHHKCDTFCRCGTKMIKVWYAVEENVVAHRQTTKAYLSIFIWFPNKGCINSEDAR